MIKNIWPNGKKFAFTIIDDCDNDRLDVINSIYNFLDDINIKTTKNVWIYPSRDTEMSGNCLLDQNYRECILNLKSLGYEIGIHGVGAGDFKKDEIADGFEIFKEIIGDYPNIHTNHKGNKDGIYVEFNRYSKLFNKIYKNSKLKNIKSYGDVYFSEYFWGNISKKYIKYIKDQEYNCTNIFKYDNYLPYVDRDRLEHSNYWFSCCDGYSYNKFNSIIDNRKIDQLIFERGLCIISTDFSRDFLDGNGEIGSTFRQNMEYISKRNGWFAPVTDILDYILKFKKTIKPLSTAQFLIKDIRKFF